MSGHLTISCPAEGHLVGTSQPPKLTTEGVWSTRDGSKPHWKQVTWGNILLPWWSWGSHLPLRDTACGALDTHKVDSTTSTHPQAAFTLSISQRFHCLTQSLKTSDMPCDIPSTPSRPVGAPRLILKNSQRKFLEQKWNEQESFHAMRKEEKTVRRDNTIQCPSPHEFSKICAVTKIKIITPSNT